VPSLLLGNIFEGVNGLPNKHVPSDPLLSCARLLRHLVSYHGEGPPVSVPPGCADGLGEPLILAVRYHTLVPTKLVENSFAHTEFELTTFLSALLSRKVELFRNILIDGHLGRVEEERCAVDLLIRELYLVGELLALCHWSCQVELEQSELNLVRSCRGKVVECIAFGHVVFDLSDKQGLLGKD
jgi:hypothetical protein